MAFEINRRGWKRGTQPNTGYLAYFSTHKTISPNNETPKWMIVKEPTGYMLYFFSNKGYQRLTGFQPHKLLKEVQYYCDVEVERFNQAQY